MNKLYLLDAFALIYRAYYALAKNPRLTSAGKNTNAQFGFTNTLLDILNKEKPTHIAVAFDSAEQTVRDIEHDFYKANREPAPEDLIASIPDIKKILEAFNIPILEAPGYEADDIVGTIAHVASDKGFEVYMVTPDKDYGQLVRENVFIWKPPAYGNPSAILGPKEVCEKWGIKRVSQVIDLLGLMGDASDNIPGIPGVGEKTAVKLLDEYDTLENVLDNAANIKGKMGEKIVANKESAIISKKLATIILDVPVSFDEEKFILEKPNTEALTEIFNELEFRTLGKRILGDGFASTTATSGSAPAASASKAKDSAQGNLFGSDADDAQDTNIILQNINDVPHTYELAQDDASIKKLIAELHAASLICFDTETTSTDANEAKIVGMSFSTKAGSGWYVPLDSKDDEAAKKVMQQFSGIFTDATKSWIGHNLKYDLLVIKWYGFTLAGTLHDTMLAHYLIEPDGKRSMDLLSEIYLRYKPISITTLIGEKGRNQGTMDNAPIDKVAEYAAEDADVTLQLHEKFAPQITEKEVQHVYSNIECPLVQVLTDMEFEGISIDVSFLQEYSKVLEKDAREAEENVYKQAGFQFNLASPKQLGEVLFDRMKLDPKAKKTKTGQYATGEDVLAKLEHNNPIVRDILIFRELTKLRSTYVDALPNLINSKTGRVHTSYNQAIAVTGRLSSNDPNLQNIPIRTTRGREIRKAFIAKDAEHVLLSADYSQIELRIVAAMANDATMISAFKAGKDIHTATASKVYKVDEAEVSKEQRRNAKAVNFGIIYGQSAFGLAENLGISRGEAKEIIDNYWLEFSSISTFLNDQKNVAREYGYAQTLSGRKRWLPDIFSANAVVRGFAERNAINMPVQGTAADMIKLAMIDIHKAMKQQKLKSKMLLQVHDELVFDCHKSEVDILSALLQEHMPHALKLPNDTPVAIEIGVGENWLEAH
jgi:DNA polymerase I